MSHELDLISAESKADYA